MTETITRVAGPGDVEKIDRLLRALAESTGESACYAGDIQALTRFGFSNPPLYRALLAEQAGAPVGLCTFFPEFSTWRCQPGLYVQDLYVEAQCQGQGLGKHLLSEAIKLANEKWQVGFMRLSVLKGNHRGQAFYNALGFSCDEENDFMLLTGSAFEQLHTKSN